MNADKHHDFRPIMSPDREYGEIKPYVVAWGLFFAAVFALAVGYLCLKIGQTIDAFAPVSIMAMGLAVILRRRDPFPENVHIQAIASAGTNMLGGAMFILPAFYILNIHMSYTAMMIPIVLGSVMGIMMSVIFRKYFCEDMHHAYPFPAGRAAVGVLTSNEGSSAKLMIASGIVGFFYDIVNNTLGWWQEVISSLTFDWGQRFAQKYKLAFALDTEAALLGLGYYTGIRYALIICAGSFFSWFVCMPIVYYMVGDHTILIGGREVVMNEVPVDVMFGKYIKYIGIGMLAMGGIIGLLRMGGVVKKVFAVAIRETIHGRGQADGPVLRTQRDLSMKFITVTMLITTILFGMAFHSICAQSLVQTLIAVVIVLIFAFMLSVVGISSIAFTGTEPVSGMTIFMLMVAALVMLHTGLSGTAGIIAVLFMAAFLATTLGMAGNFMSELKVAHLTGATPKKMQQWQIIAAVIVSILSVGVVMLLNQAYGFTGKTELAAPQANMFATMASTFMEGGTAHTPLLMAGALFALILWMLDIPVLAFALGTYLPMEINTPLLLGGLISWLVRNSSKDEKLVALRVHRGEIVSSGLVAGGALGGLISAVLRIMGYDWYLEEWSQTPAATYWAIVVYLGLCLMLWR
ncbi:MAG: OPT/YSL family transporter, partial [Negativicutes bacterium]|nr:OPT/YSL family transporter [Negativicutes bacterium]